MIKLFWYIIYLLSPLIPIIAIYIGNPSKYSNPLMEITMIFAVCAFVWLGFEFILSSRIKFVEKYFGMDKYTDFTA